MFSCHLLIHDDGDLQERIIFLIIIFCLKTSCKDSKGFL